MKLKRFGQVDENHGDLNDFISREMGDEYKKVTPSVEEELKKYKDCIKEIEYTLTHIKKQPYDYGEGTDTAIEEVIDLINEVRRRY